MICRFAEILQCAEGLSEDQVKAAIKKSRLLFNRGEVNEVSAQKGLLGCSILIWGPRN